jgi:hypothetical protein
VKRALVLSVALAAPLHAQPAGGEFRVNTTTTGGQNGGVVASAADGSFVVVWTSSDGAGTGVFGQRYAADGSPQGGEFRVNETTTGAQSGPWVSRDSLGGFVVVWSGDDLALATPDVFARRYGADGAALGNAFRVNAATTGAQTQPRVASAPGGDFVVVWAQPDGDGNGVFARRYTGAGGAVGSEFRVNDATTGAQGSPAVAMDAFGRFRVVWQDQDGSSTGIRAAIYGATGTPIGAPFAVNTYTTGAQATPFVASDPEGYFLVTWTNLQATPREIEGRTFAPDGTPFSAELRVNTSTSGAPDAASAASGRDYEFLAVWDDGADVFAQRVGLFGDKLGAELRVNAVTSSFQQTPRITANGRNFVVVWRDGGTTDTEDVMGQRFNRARVKGDVDGSGVVNVLDVFYLINFLFAGGPPPSS